MPDPLSLVALGAAVGGAAGKFVEKAWDSGERWIGAYFADHHSKAIEQARENGAAFLNHLAARVKQLEDSHAVSADAIAASQQHPGFSVALQAALISASQTSNNDKHQLLARLVSSRLQSAPDSLLAMATRMACDSISMATPTQLKLLGLDAAVAYVGPTEQLTESAYLDWLLQHLRPFIPLEPSELDLLHLEALSCLKLDAFVGRNLEQVLKNKRADGLDFAAFVQTDTGVAVKELWEQKGLQRVTLTSVGQLLGVYVLDLLSGSETEFSQWK